MGRRACAALLASVLLLCLAGCGEGTADGLFEILGDLYEMTSSHAVQAPPGVWWERHRHDFWHGAWEGEASLDLGANGFSVRDLSLPALYSEPAVETAVFGRVQSVTALLGPGGTSCGVLDFTDPVDGELPGYEHNGPYPGVVSGDLFRQAPFLPGGSGERCLATAYAWEAGLGPCFDEVREYLAGDGRAMWRMTAVYDGLGLMPEGFLVEFQSLDGGLSFCRYFYNVQPGVGFDYATGRNWLEAAGDPEAEEAQEQCPEDGQQPEG